MNFIESIMESFSRGLKQISGEIPNDIKSYVIGSGSTFELHAYISFQSALKIYRDYKSNLHCLGKRISNKESGDFIFESYHCMESNSGVVYCFMFPVSSLIFHNPNDVIYEFTDTLEKQEQFRKSIRETFLKCEK